MYNKAILRLEEEIAHRTKLLSNIKRFKELTLDEKIQTIKECTLRYERDTMPQILQKDFKSKLLREQATAEIGVNNLTLTFESYTVNIGLYNGKIVEIENSNKIFNPYNHSDYECKNEIIEYAEIINKSKNKLIALENFQNKPSFNNYKSITTNTSPLRIIYYVLYKNNILNQSKSEISQVKDGIRYFKGEIKKCEELPIKTEKIKTENDEFLKLIEDDIKYFEENGYSIYYKFKKLW